MNTQRSLLRNTANPAVFSVKPFKNRNGTISFRVSGWLLGERIRKNFKSREAAIIGRESLQLKQAQASSSIRIVSTFLSDAQLREAEAAFHKLKESPRTLSFYLDYAMENYREARTDTTVADAVDAYLVERGNDMKQSIIGQRQFDNIDRELALFKAFFREKTLAELTTARLLEYIRRGGKALKTQNNRHAILFTLCKYACAQNWLAANPLDGVKRHRIDYSRGSAATLTAEQAARLMAHVETVHDGALVPFFALCLFAGIRPEGEISKLPASDVRLENGAINIEPWVSKVNMRRVVNIQPNLAAWLRAYPLDQFPIIPPKDKVANFLGKLSELRRQFKIGHDVLRHTFISMHVAKYRSLGDVALQAGNSEKIVGKHYLNVTTSQEAEAFFAIMPAKQPAQKTSTNAQTETNTTATVTAPGTEAASQRAVETVGDAAGGAASAAVCANERSERIPLAA